MSRDDRFSRAKRKVEETVADVSAPAYSIMNLVMIAGFTGAATAGALYLFQKARKK